MGIQVTVRKLPGTKNEFTFEEGSTVADLLDAAGIPKGYDVRINGETAEPERQLESGDSALAAPSVAGA